MADFEYPFTSAGTPTSFAIGDSGVTGIDEAGTITPKVVRLADNIHLLLTATKTDAELTELFNTFIRRYGAGHEGFAGGFTEQATLQVAGVETSVPAPAIFVGFEYAFASAGTPTSFPIGNSGITGIDEAGTITPVIVVLAANVNLLLTAVKTNAQITAAMLAFVRRYDSGHDGAGGFPAQATLQVAPAETSVPAAD